MQQLGACYWKWDWHGFLRHTQRSAFMSVTMHVFVLLRCRGTVILGYEQVRSFRQAASQPPCKLVS